MAASGFTPIQLYRSATPGAVPLAADLAPGELAINTADEKLFLKNAAGAVVSIDRANGTVTSVSGAGAVNGITLTGAVTTAGSITLGGALSGVDLASQTTGTLAVGRGGTGQTTYLNGELLIGNTTGGTLSKATLTAGSGVSITNGAGAITIAATGSGGTVTSVAGAGAVSGLTLTGTVTSAGSLTLGGTLAVVPSNFASQAANTILAAPSGVAGVPTFRTIVAADVPTLNQNTTGTAANVTGVVAVANGGTGVTTSTGTGSVVLATSPVLVTPTLGAASATSIVASENFFAATGGVWFSSANTFTRGIAQAGSDMNFFTANTERMRIDSAGNVGIGTSSPGAKLDVAGTGSGASLRLQNQTASTGKSYEIISGDSGPLRFQDITAGTERMRIDPAGNVGIGTSSPLARFRVIAGANVNAPTLGSITNYPAFLSNADGNYGFGIGLNAADGHVWLQGQRTDTGTAAYNITLNEAGGNVGIGTSAPQAKLDVVGTSLLRADAAGGAQPLVVRNDSTANVTTKTSSLVFQGVDTVGTGKNAALIQCGPDDPNYIGAFLAFLTRSGDASPTERFRITSTGAITSSDRADAVGYKGIPPNSQTAAYTLALSDMGKHISTTTGGVVIPANAGVAFPIGSTIVIYNNSAATQAISITTDTLRLAGTATVGTRTLAQRGIATCIKVLATEWVVTGNVT